MNVVFSLRKDQKSKNGLAVIYWYISHNGMRSKKASSGIRVYEHLWQKKYASGQNSKPINDGLDNLRADLTDLFNQYKSTISHIQEIADFYLKKESPQISMLDLYDKLVEKRSVGVARGTITIYNNFKKNWLKPYLKSIGNLNMEARHFNYKHLEQLKNFMLDSGKIKSTEYLEKSLARVKAAVKLGYSMELLEKDAVAQYSLNIKHKKREYVYLDIEELKRFAELTFSEREKHLELARDLFLVQCYTSLSYGELKDFNVKKNHIETDDWEWILQKRGKTNGIHYIPLLPEALELLKKLEYNTTPTANHTYNQNIRICMYRARIDKYMRSHFGKHTAGAFFLNSGIDINVVQKVLGHSSIKTTEKVYAKMIHTWGVKNEFDRVFRNK
ncbi:tyrosine-type recombinase/integrase [Bernardetia sp. ABR2-2B]|uniref:tyrosine-type recombinase/integrase n=1 Tax=Bernardetia sp. ABR2-2B TaxID=3127472 RepID=UPI0030D2CA07